jgi:hypothetical protein
MPVGDDGFDPSVPLPPGLKVAHIRRAIQYIEQQAEDWLDLYYEQANVFSAVIGILGIRALHSFSPYKRHKHPDVAQQRFPDPSLNAKIDPPAKEALESKGTTRPWPVQAHYDHPGCYVVWRYAIDETKAMKGHGVAIWRVDIPFLHKEDWKYEGSKASGSGGGRTHTFGLRNPAKRLAGAVVHRAPNIALFKGRPVLMDPETEK